jgi:hypothetical protein
MGFRIAGDVSIIPEPATITLLLVAVLFGAVRTTRRRRR